MSTTLIQHFEQMQQAGVEYRAQWTTDEINCKCGVKCRVDIEVVGGVFAAPFYQHCSKDVGKLMPGLLLSLWEERAGAWVLVEKFRK